MITFPGDGPPMTGQWEEVARFLDIGAALAAKSMLEAYGVIVLLPEQNVAQGYDALPLTVGGMRLLTPHDQAADARALLEAPAELDNPADFN
jgi:hypothetical protein